MLELVVSVNTKQLQDCRMLVIGGTYLFGDTLGFGLEARSEEPAQNLDRKYRWSGHEPGQSRLLHSQLYIPVSCHLPSWLRK